MKQLILRPFDWASSLLDPPLDMPDGEAFAHMMAGVLLTFFLLAVLLVAGVAALVPVVAFVVSAIEAVVL